MSGRRRGGGHAPTRLLLSASAILIKSYHAEVFKEKISSGMARSPGERLLAELVRIAGMRWRIESCFEEAKGETGLDECEVRAWTGWHRHITLSMLAHAYLTVVRQHASGGEAPVV